MQCKNYTLHPNNIKQHLYNPIIIIPKKRNITLLWGRQRYSGEWGGFGGKKEEIDNDSPLDTVARELAEELINSLSVLEEDIKKGSCPNLQTFYNIHYGLELSPTTEKIKQLSEEKIFGLRKEHVYRLKQEGLTESQMEIEQLGWIKVSSLQKKIDFKTPDPSIVLEEDRYPYTLYKMPCKNSKIVTKKARFRPCAVTTLKSIAFNCPKGFENFYSDLPEQQIAILKKPSQKKLWEDENIPFAPSLGSKRYGGASDSTS